MNSFTKLNKDTDKIHEILEAYNKDVPFVDSKDIPNNWLKMHGYTKHKKPSFTKDSLKSALADLSKKKQESVKETGCKAAIREQSMSSFLNKKDILDRYYR